jgi:ABC-type phosphate transport system permease subunit
MLAFIGFFVIPVVGFFIGFPLGVYLEERRRLGPHAPAWRSTQEALRAMGLSIVIELAATVVAAGAWLGAVLS